MSGDIRRGLELCIRAVEIAEAEFRCAAWNAAREAIVVLHMMTSCCRQFH